MTMGLPSYKSHVVRRYVGHGATARARSFSIHRACVWVRGQPRARVRGSRPREASSLCERSLGRSREVEL